MTANRCPLCNGRLRPSVVKGIPQQYRNSTPITFVCKKCGKEFYKINRKWVPVSDYR